MEGKVSGSWDNQLWPVGTCPGSWDGSLWARLAAFVPLWILHWIEGLESSEVRSKLQGSLLCARTFPKRYLRRCRTPGLERSQQTARGWQADHCCSRRLSVLWKLCFISLSCSCPPCTPPSQFSFSVFAGSPFVHAFNVFPVEDVTASIFILGAGNHLGHSIAGPPQVHPLAHAQKVLTAIVFPVYMETKARTCQVLFWFAPFHPWLMDWKHCFCVNIWLSPVNRAQVNVKIVTLNKSYWTFISSLLPEKRQPQQTVVPEPPGALFRCKTPDCVVGRVWTCSVWSPLPTSK